MQTMLVRLKPYDPRRGFVLRRYTYQGIKFHEERGWYRVDKSVADYLRGVRQVAGDAHAPLAFDVHTESEAKALEAEQDAAATVRKKATDPVEAVAPSVPAAAVTTDDLEASGSRRGNRSK